VLHRPRARGGGRVGTAELERAGISASRLEADFAAWRERLRAADPIAGNAAFKMLCAD